jgi:hypothetical protein
MTMQPIPDLFPEPDIISMLIEESLPWLPESCAAAAIFLAGLTIAAIISKVREQKSPVEKLVRRRGFGV